jgi:hypothetical protein
MGTNVTGMLPADSAVQIGIIVHYLIEELTIKYWIKIKNLLNLHPIERFLPLIFLQTSREAESGYF